MTASGAAYGVEFRLEAGSSELLARMRELLPPAWADGTVGDHPFTLRVASDGSDGYTLERDRHPVVSGHPDDVLDGFERQFRTQVALHAPEHVFIHAGAVAHGGRAIVIPGASFSGKTSLTAALVRAGAAYYSDEYAVLDTDGRVQGYPKPLAVRLSSESPRQHNQTSGQLGGVSATDPLPLGLVVATSYRPGATWAPVELSRAEAVLALIEHASQGQTHPQRVMQRLGLAVQQALLVKSDRGEAAEVAADLLARLR